jgi:RimJ/RimL family protein N-acetyltransferase
VYPEGKMGFERRIKDGRSLHIAHVERTDAAEMVAYVNRVCGESDYLTSGPSEFEITVADEEKFIDGLDGGRFNFMLKGVVNGEIVSLCQIASRRNRPRIRHLGEFGITVARSHWGLGVGRAMCLAMLDVARQVGVTKVDLRVREDNVNAIRLYESLGFRREGMAARALQIGDRYFSDLLMGKCLD